MTNPIFILSLPRSGSTLLQRILMSHKDIYSLAEPWILIPVVNSFFNKELSLSEYSGSTCANGIEDFIKSLPNKDSDLFPLLNTFITGLYEKQCLNNERYFLDKTPRYYLFIPEILKIFPNAKYIVLTRNYLDVLSSIIKTWGKGHLRSLHRNEIDLVKGPLKISEGIRLLKDKAFILKYEELVSNPVESLEQLFKYLELDFDSEVITTFSQQKTSGRLGDPTGILKYTSLDKKSIIGWKNVLTTKVRLNVARHYLNKISFETVELLGYNKMDMLSEINSVKRNAKWSLVDLIDIVISKFILKSNLNLWFYGRTKTKIRGKFFS